MYGVHYTSHERLPNPYSSYLYLHQPLNTPTKHFATPHKPRAHDFHQPPQ